MRISRLYIDQPLSQNCQLRVTGQQAHYLSKVLRLKANTPVHVFDGKGAEFSAHLTAISRHEVELQVDSPLPGQSESPLHTILGLGLSRGERMDYAIQKSTEMGVSVIVPLFTEFCEVKLEGPRLQKKLQHWQQICISACEQSGRTIVPAVLEPQSLSTWCQAQNSPVRLVFCPTGNALTSKDPSISQISLLIGPEGGFSTGELTNVETAGFERVQLGPRVLRTETAPIVALTAVQLMWGDFRI
jgi:16S rRNA (uracil1498-N3)-methyltransferase